MRKINYLIISVMIVLFLLPSVIAQQSEVDTFVRANNAALGTATNGNLWGETGEGAAGSFQILNNAMRFTSNSADQAVYADLNLSTKLTQNGEYIRLNARPNTAGAAFGVIQLFDSQNVLIFDLYYQLEDNANDCLYNKTVVYTAKAASQESCLFGSNDDTSVPKPANLTLYMNFTAQTISVELKNSSVTARNVSARMRGTSIMNVSWIRIGRGGTISGGTIDLLNVTQFNIPAVAPTSPPNITATAVDEYDGSAINNFSIDISGNGQNYNLSTNNGTILFTNLTEGLSYNLRYSSFANGGYFNKTYSVLASGGSFQAQLYQVLVLINASEVISGNSIANFAARVGNQYNQSTPQTLQSTLQEDLSGSAFESQGCATGDGGLAHAIDGDWFTSTNGGTVYENYSKPSNLLNASLFFKYEILGSSSGGIKFNTSCYDGSNYLTLMANGTLGSGGNFSVGLPSGCIAQSVIQIKTINLKTGTSCSGGVGIGGYSNYYEGAMNYTTQGEGFARLLLKAGTYNIIGNTTGYLNATESFTFFPYSENNVTLDFGSNLLRIDARSIISNSYISSFSVRATNGNYSELKSTTNGNLTFSLIAGTYYLNFSSDAHANANASIVVSSSSIYPNYTFSVYTTNSINVSIWDEILGIPNPFFFNRSVTLEFSSSVFSQNYTTLTDNFYVDLLTPTEYQIRYSSPDYTPRFYYFELTNRTNNNIDLFLLSEGNGTNVIFTVQDNTGNLLEDAIVYLQRYYIQSNSYKTVAMEKTNAEGQVVFDVDFNSAFYKVTVVYGQNVLVTNGAKIFQSSISLTMDINTDPLSEIHDVNSISSYITFNENTQTFSLNALNLQGTSVPFSLSVSKIDATGLKTEVCTNSDTFVSGTILCFYNTSADSGSYIAEGTANLGGYVPDVVVATFTRAVNTLQQQAVNTFGRDGLLYSILFSGFMALLVSGAGAIAALIAFVGAFGISMLIGLVFFGFGTYSSLIVFISLLIGALAIGWRISR